MDIRLITILSFKTRLEGSSDLLIGLWQSNKNVCEYRSSGEKGQCDNSGMYYGTDYQTDPMVCARHFYQIVASGDGKTSYKLVDLAAEKWAPWKFGARGCDWADKGWRHPKPLVGHVNRKSLISRWDYGMIFL
jgi:hypothetical protein